MFMSEAEMQAEAKFVRQVADEWLRNFRPTVAPRLVTEGEQGEYNFKTMGEYCFQKFGAISISYLNQAYSELSAAKKLYLYAAPVKKTPAEIEADFQARERKRMEADRIANRVPFNERAIAHQNKQDADKNQTARQAAAKAQRDTLIDNYSVTIGPNRIDHARSENLRNEMRKIDVKRNGVTDWVEVLKLVQEALSNMP
jgi:hypothetical protein